MVKPVITFPLLDLTLDFPNYFTVFGFKIYWYGVLIAAGFVLGVIYCLRHAKEFGLSQDSIYDAFIIIVPSAIIGARAYYVIFNYDLYRDNFASIFSIRDGGLGIYGGIILCLIAMAIYCRVKKVPFWALADVASFAILIGAAIGRWGNFINREAYGCFTDLPWKMGLTYPSGTTVFVHPAFLYESLWNLLGFLLLHFVVRKRRRFDGEVFALFAAWYGAARIVLESIRTDNLLVMGTQIPISQIVGAVSIFACIVVMFAKRHASADGLYVNKLSAAAELCETENAGEEAEGVCEDVTGEIDDVSRDETAEITAEADDNSKTTTEE